MTAMHLVLVASLTGALLFFVAGAALSALRHRAGANLDQLSLQARVEAAEAAHARVAHHRDAAVADVARLQAIDRARATEIEEIRRSLDAADTNVRDHAHVLEDPSTVVKPDPATTREMQALRRRAELAEAAAREATLQRQTANHEAGTLRADLERVQRELTTAEMTARQLRSAGDERASLLDRSRTESIAATTELDELRTRLRDAERQLAERGHAVRDLSTENEQLKGRVRDAEGIRNEYVRLRTATIESEFLKSEVDRLQQELRTVRVEALGAPDARPRPARGTARQPTSPTRSIGESLAGVLDRFADPGTRSIAIGDVQGFPLASSGNDGVALAAYAALLIESATRAREFLPVGAPSAIEIIDEKGARVSVWAFNVESERMMLANLAVSPVDSKRLETTLADLATILAPGKVASGTHT